MSLLILLTTVLGFFFNPQSAFAQTPPSVSATPSILQLDLRTESADTSIYYKNLSQQTVNIALRAQDFNGLPDEGKVNFLDEKDAKSYQYSLSSWIHFETEVFSLDPGEE